MKDPVLVWGIDDTPSMLAMIEATLAPYSERLTLELFQAADDALLEFRARLETEARLPDVILMDYYIGNSYGSDVTEAIRLHFDDGEGPIIVGHSSMPSASRAIVAKGGDFFIPKRKRPVSPHLQNLFETREATRHLLEHRRPPGWTDDDEEEA